MSAPDRSRAGLIVGVDGSNLRQGGGVTHLVELVTAGEPEEHGIARLVVWGGRKLLGQLPARPWLEPRHLATLERGPIRRAAWQRFGLSRMATEAGCDLVFAPGGRFDGSFRPVVTMSRNLLPFESGELRRYGWSPMALRLRILRWSQSNTFRSADGVIFLTEYARQTVSRVSGEIPGRTPIIPHGTSDRFRVPPRPQRPIHALDPAHPFRILYVSPVQWYKHQWNVVEAVAALRKDHGYPVALDLVGPGSEPAVARLRRSLARHDPRGEWATYHGAEPYQALHRRYAEADLGVFASSCENLPNTLLEMMAAGLPIACSDRGPMEEVLGDGGLYFDPERPPDLTRALERLIASPELRTEVAARAFERALRFSWALCARSTFAFLASVARGERG